MRTAVVFLSVLALTGCVGSHHPVTPAPSPTSTPLFASDEEALKAAEAAYQRYTDTTVALLSNANDFNADLPKVAAGRLLEAELKAFSDARQKGLHGSGKVVFRDFRLQSLDYGSREVLRAYVCEDVSDFALSDSSGNSVVSPDRPGTAIYELAFQFSKAQQLLLSHKELWKAEDC